MDRASPSAIENEDFDAFYTRCQPIFTSQVQLNFDVDYDTADQLVTNALLRLKAAHDRDPEAVQLKQGSHFLRTLLAHEMADYSRRERGRDQQKLQFESLTAKMDKIDERADPTRRLDNSDFVQHILQPLPKRTRNILMRHYVDEVTLEEIGSEVNVCFQRVAAICQGTLEQLRRQHIEDYV
jgi:RNA polymerase sigma factor (sigma-70 family)